MRLTTHERLMTRLLRLGLPLGVSLAALTGCEQSGGSGSEGEGGGVAATPLTHTEAQALVQDTIRSSSASLEERLRFLDGDTRLIQAFDELFGSTEDDCYVEDTGEGEEVIICDGEVFDELGPEPEPESIRIDFMEETEDFTSSLLEELREDAVVANAAQLTYQLNPNELCDMIGSDDELDPEDREPASEPSADSDCVALAEREAPRLQLTRQTDGISAALLVAQGQEEAIGASLTSTSARISLDLGVLARLLNELVSEEGEAALNVAGAISLEMDTSVANQATFRFNVDRAISVSGQFDDVNQINFTFPAARDVFSITSNSADSSFAVRFDIPKLVQSFSASLTQSYEYDPETDEEVLVDEGPVRNIVGTLGGLDLGVTLRLVGEGVESTLEVGLGDETSHIEVDGQKVVQVDLNPNNGRLLSFNLNRTDFDNEDLMLALASELHELKVQLNLTSLAELDFDDWMTDEVFKVVLTSAGGELPSFVFESAKEQLKLLVGHLEVSAERAGIEHVVEGGQCMMSSGEGEGDTSISEQIDEPIDEPIDEEASHPLEEMEVGMCR